MNWGPAALTVTKTTGLFEALCLVRNSSTGPPERHSEVVVGWGMAEKNSENSSEMDVSPVSASWDELSCCALGEAILVCWFHCGIKVLSSQGHGMQEKYTLLSQGIPSGWRNVKQKTSNIQMATCHTEHWLLLDHQVAVAGSQSILKRCVCDLRTRPQDKYSMHDGSHIHSLCFLFQPVLLPLALSWTRVAGLKSLRKSAQHHSAHAFQRHKWWAELTHVLRCYLNFGDPFGQGEKQPKCHGFSACWGSVLM